ncbi:MAG TPA: universal stress protein [Nitrososphaeraceae archaeon]|nr:universal stress protein [Nitrososphaeraceae archaeon]
MENKGSTPQLRTEKILMAIDRSPSKYKVAVYGATLAKALQARLIAIHVIETSPPSGLEDFVLRNYETSQRKEAENLLNETKGSAKSIGIEIDTEIVVKSHSIADTIIDYAKNKNVDLILVGTIGMTGLQKYLLGSVADKIVTHAQCSVLAVR